MRAQPGGGTEAKRDFPPAPARPALSRPLVLPDLQPSPARAPLQEAARGQDLGEPPAALQCSAGAALLAWGSREGRRQLPPLRGAGRGGPSRSLAGSSRHLPPASQPASGCSSRRGGPSQGQPEPCPPLQGPSEPAAKLKPGAVHGVSVVGQAPELPADASTSRSFSPGTGQCRVGGKGGGGK